MSDEKEVQNRVFYETLTSGKLGSYSTPREVWDLAWEACSSDWKSKMEDAYVNMFHPEFGSEWLAPDGQCHKAFQRGVEEGKKTVEGKAHVSIFQD